MKSTHTSQVIYLLIKELRVAVTRQSVFDEIEKHPDAESLLAISDVLNNWSIPNEAYTLTVNELIDVGLASPFIAYLSAE